MYSGILREAKAKLSSRPISKFASAKTLLVSEEPHKGQALEIISMVGSLRSFAVTINREYAHFSVPDQMFANEERPLLDLFEYFGDVFADYADGKEIDRAEEEDQEQHGGYSLGGQLGEQQAAH